jgi:hypothetical protein
MLEREEDLPKQQKEIVMSNLRQRSKALRDLGMFFAEKGKVLSQQEYIDATDKPIPFSGVRNVFRSYSRAVQMIERNEPDLWELIHAPKAPKVEAAKPTPKVAVPKPTKSKEDGKDI